MDTKSDWGYYAPPPASWALRMLIAIGLARGKLRKIIIHYWKNQFGPIIDIDANGVRYRLNLDDNVTDGRILTSFSRYDSREIKVLRDSCKDHLFVDIGANVGFYSLALASEGSKVLAIEPNPKSLIRLKFNTTINSFADRINILPIGIGEKGKCELVSNGDLGSANIRPNESVFTESVTISIQPLLEVLKEQNVDQIGGIKIDIEGMEDRALVPFFRSAPRRLWPKCIVIEDCNSNHWENDIIKSMQDTGYYNVIFRTRGNVVLQKKHT